VNVTVLPYVRIGEHSIVGAGSVVVHDIPDGVIGGRSPAVVLRPVRRQEVAARVGIGSE
jgi:acetyltransferase-like isoleucine patch superfamily enzyme